MTPSVHTSSLKRSPTGAVVAVVGVALAGAALGLWWWMRSPDAQGVPPESAPAAKLTEVRDEIESPAASAPAKKDVPPTTPEQVSTNSVYRSWLGENDFDTRAVGAVARVADGESPAALLQFMRPQGAFQVEERGDKLFIADASFQRYDAIVDVIDSIDASKAVAAYRTMYPALLRIHAQIARPGVTLDATVQRALAHLLATPTPPNEIEVVPAQGINYAYADQALEKKSAAQKHLLRMGKKNAERMKAKLREVHRAL